VLVVLCWLGVCQVEHYPSDCLSALCWLSHSQVDHHPSDTSPVCSVRAVLAVCQVENHPSDTSPPGLSVLVCHVGDVAATWEGVSMLDAVQAVCTVLADSCY
jgi:hypothetical protein